MLDSKPANEIIILHVPAAKRPERLDVYITHAVENATRNKVQQAIDEGTVLVNDKTSKSSYKVAPNDVVQITLPRPPAPDAEPENIDIEIVYEDEFLLLVNKKAGMVVHPAYANYTGTLVNALLFHIEKLSSFHEDPIRPGIVHRIDKETSGLLLIAKNDQIHAKLSKDFVKHNIQREYWAICVGNPRELKGTISTFIARDPKDRKRFSVHKSDGKWAVTHYEVIQQFDGYSLMKLHLETGRTHQIRVHLTSLGLPILGDSTYGGKTPPSSHQTGLQKSTFKKLLETMPRQALHAKTLGFFHYGLDKHVSFDSQIPEDFSVTLEILKKYNLQKESDE